MTNHEMKFRTDEDVTLSLHEINEGGEDVDLSTLRNLEVGESTALGHTRLTRIQ